MIADEASPELASIRRQIRITNNKVKETLQSYVGGNRNKYLQENLVTMRNGRYVVPVKAEYRNEIKGLVHDTSSSGATLFVEPMAVVDANNELKRLASMEQHEIERILCALSAEVGDASTAVSRNYHNITELAFYYGCASLSFEMKAQMPEIVNARMVDLRRARHPLLDKETVVPIDVAIGVDYDTLIVTGPNTGGKTVTLKTIGLLTLMAECGLHVPAGDGSQLSTFNAILADIGDEQSIAQSLSTFSSHMKTIVDVVAQCDDRTLVLFDELGAGTDPAEGAALAMAIIEFCRKMGSRVVATTHYAELKLYAMRTKGVINASCEFDVETLRPTYKLLIGIPGKSNAFAISRKLGLSEEILKEADDLVGKSDKDFEDVLSQLEQQRQQMEQARVEAERLRKETANIKAQSEQYHAQLQKEKDKALEAARREAQEIIEDARRTANAAADEIKALKKQLAEGADTSGINQRQADLRRNLNEAQSRIRANQPEKERPEPTREIIIGDTVELLKLGTKANVIAINKDGTYQLQAGILKMSAKKDEIYLLEQENPYKDKHVRPAHSGREMKLAAFSPEVDLRGMDTIEAVCVMERYLDEAMRSGLKSVRIIHGKGTGAVRAAVHQALKKNKFVKKFRLGQYGEGEDGVTIAEFT
jgi:DNA mismatch repair protein MutS2